MLLVMGNYKNIIFCIFRELFFWSVLARVIIENYIQIIKERKARATG